MKKSTKAILILLILIAASGFGFCLGKFIILWNDIEHSASIFSQVAPYFFGCVGCGILFFLSIYFYKVFEVRGLRQLAYFTEDIHNLASKSRFVLIVSKLYKNKIKNKNQKMNQSYMVSIGLKDFEELELSTLTEEEMDDLLKTFSKYLEQNYISLKEHIVYSSYEGNGVFNLYFERESREVLVNEVKEMIHSLKMLFSEKTYAPSIILYTGFYEMKDANVDNAINNASIARYYNEKNTQVALLYFDPFMKKENREMMQMKGEITRGLENGEFEVYYQPKFNIKLNRFVGAEALVRWHHPKRGLLSPGAFIPFAEQNGQIVDIDRYVMEHVCQDIVSWKENKTRLLLISINMSRNEIFKTDIVEYYRSMITKYHISPLLIEIEITESAVSKDMLYAVNVVQQLKSLRFKTSMDDFGTGYSSLSYLKKIPVDTLKLDKSFFDEVEIDKRSRDIVSTTIQLAKALEMNVIAEGIQTEKQVNFLKTTNCDCIQGYYYSPALPKQEYEAFLRNNRFEA